MSLVYTLRQRLPSPVRRIAGKSLALVRNTSHALARPYLEMRRNARRARVREAEAARKPVALFLAPDAAVRSYLAAHAIVARTIDGQGITPIFLSCNGLLPTCTAKEVFGQPPTVPGADTEVCRMCRQTALSVGNAYDLPDISIESVLTDSDRETIAAMVAAPFDTLLTLEYDSVAFGTFVLGDTLRRRRLTDASEFGYADRALFRALMHAALLTYFAVCALSARFDIRRISFFGDYAYWLPAQVFAARHGIGLAGFDYGYNVDIDRRFIGIRPVSANAQALHKVRDWPRYRDRPLPPDMSLRIFEGGLHRLGAWGGKSTYSPNWIRRATPLQQELGLSMDRKTIIAYPSSSDEFVALSRILDVLGTPFATARRPFIDQAAWLEALVDWVDKRDDLQLVIRWHPRMGISRNTTTRASEYAFFREKFATYPSNVVMIWPEDKASSYNLAEICDVTTAAWSTIGLEVARFGVPVVAAFPDIGNYPVGSFIGFGETPADYFRAIETALGQPASLDAVTESLRWTHYLFWSPLVEVADVVPSAGYQDVPPWKRPDNAAAIERAMVSGEDMSVINMDRLPRGSEADAAERQAVLAAMRRLLVFFISGQDRPEAQIRVLRPLPGGEVAARIDGKTYQCYSPLAARVARMMTSEAPELQ